jgi:predicted nucleic acid-binding protein
MIVLDASVILKFVFEESNTPKALHLREKHISGEDKIAAPELLYYELANVLATKAQISEKIACSALTEIFNLEFENFTLGSKEFLFSIKLSHKHKISVYDASYMTLAQSLGCDFITADVKLFKKIKMMNFVRLLR